MEEVEEEPEEQEETYEEDDKEEPDIAGDWGWPRAEPLAKQLRL